MDERFARDAAIFVPQRLVGTDGSIDLATFMADINEIVARRGIVLGDGQVIKTPFSQSIGFELYGDASAFDTPPHRDWSDAQRRFFDLDNPHQMAEVNRPGSDGGSGPCFQMRVLSLSLSWFWAA